MEEDNVLMWVEDQKEILKVITEISYGLYLTGSRCDQFAGFCGDGDELHNNTECIGQLMLRDL
jgi:hypothetical protein